MRHCIPAIRCPSPCHHTLLTLLIESIDFAVLTGLDMASHSSAASDNGRCVMRGSCGTAGSRIDAPLPCVYDGRPIEVRDQTRQALVEVCGSSWSEGPTCCDSDQIETLSSNMQQLERLVANCPACRNNFHDFFCTMTCSPRQAEFLNVTTTLRTSSGTTAVKSLDFHVSEEYVGGFYDSCKNVQQFGTPALDLIAPGSKNGWDLVQSLGQYKATPPGSPFQIDFPHKTPAEMAQFDARARHCADEDLANRCTCVDCPSVCATLPSIPPNSGSTCHIGQMSCFTFVLTLGYSLIAVAFLTGFFSTRIIRARRAGRYNDASSIDSHIETPLSPRINTLVGASSLAHHPRDTEDTLGTPSEARHLGRGASLLDPIETVQPRQYKFNNVLRRFFYRLGLSTASRPWLTFALVFAVVGVLNLGWSKFAVETDPVRLWVAPTSESKLQQEYFEENFGPFYRVEQVFLTSTNRTWSGEQASPLSWNTLKFWFDTEAEIRGLVSPTGVTFEEICFKPLGEDSPCVVQSPLAWFNNDLDKLGPEIWPSEINRCANKYGECLPEFLQPMAPKFVLGGVPDVDGVRDYASAKAMVITAIVTNTLDEAELARIESWERVLREYLEDLRSRAPREAGLHVAFSTGVSLTEEINKSTNMDIRIIILSYVGMFIYVALTLGGSAGSSNEDSLVGSLLRWVRGIPGLFRRDSVASSTFIGEDRPTWLPRVPNGLFINSKILLGLFSIALVILSVSTSVGAFSALGVKVTLIIAEVIPFLVLAVGVDNVFILVHEVDRQNSLHGPNALATSNGQTASQLSGDDLLDRAPAPTLLSAEERVARALARMGPSILLSTITEVLAFALGALVPMPAVRNFALYAAGSVFLNALLQVTVFVSALTLDLHRVEAGRVDIFPCIRLNRRITLPNSQAARDHAGKMGRFIRRYYAPFILSSSVKSCVLAFFGGLFVTSIISIQHIELGLDEKLALPSDSYLVDWFTKIEDYYEVGPPVYFVTQGINVTQRSDQQHLCARFTTCDDYSLPNVIESERQRSNTSYIVDPAAPWVDDFFNWLNPGFEDCCRIYKQPFRSKGYFCPPDESARQCQPCYEDRAESWNITMNGFPEGQEFMDFLKHWLTSPTTEECPYAGAARYGTAISLTGDTSEVQASHFQTFHAPLKTQADYINAFNAARRIADDISQRTGAKVFPYSVFHVFFDQYTHIVAIAEQLLGLGLAAVLVVTATFLGSWRTGIIVTGVVALTVTSCVGVMAVWGVSLNALSVVNLVISLGIAVEFCAHLARAFMNAGSGLPVEHIAGQKERDERMATALVDVGPSVLSGITFTKLIGISVLALTRSKLLETYYFRMWLTLIISGALHGLILLPVVLSLAGGPGFPYQEADEEWMTNAIRDDYEYAPFLADDDSIHSN